MNAIAWLMLCNIIMMCLNVWVLYQASDVANMLEELHTKNWGRFSELLNQCKDLKDKHESAIRKQ